MTSIKEHKRKVREHLVEINDAIDIGIKKRPSTIGFHCSVCATELLELYLHLLNKISPGKQIKHNWFRRPKENQKIEPLPERKIGVEFPDKDKIYSLIYRIEEERDNLVYGKSSEEQARKVLSSFQKLRKKLEDKIEGLGETIE